jgi:hypothetical protein
VRKALGVAREEDRVLHFAVGGGRAFEFAGGAAVVHHEVYGEHQH